MFSEVSTNGMSPYLIKLGTSSGIDSVGYFSASDSAGSTSTSTAGFIMRSTSASDITHGMLFVGNIGGNVFVETHAVGRGGVNASSNCGGFKTLSGVLDRIQITTVNGTDSFDLGVFGVLIEG